MPSALLTRSVSPDTGLSQLARRARNNRHDADAQHTYGYALVKAGRAAESLAWLERAAELDPSNPAIQINLAGALHRVGRWNEGLWHATRAHEIAPHELQIAINVGAFYYWFGEIQEASEWFVRAIEIDPSSWKAWWMWLYMLDFLPVSAAEALAARRKFNAAHQAPLRQFWPKHKNNPDPERKLRIGLTGGDFRQHSSSYMWGPMFEHLDRDRFEIFSYAHTSSPDALTEWFLTKGSEAWRDVSNCYDDRVLADQIRRDEVDVLVDLGTFSDNSHLMAHLYKPAPVSLTAWGHLTGTGLDCMDGVLVDRVMVPPGTEWEMTEQPAYVPYALGWYQPKAHHQIAIPPRPDRPLTFGYLGRIQKIDDPTVALWADLLHTYPESRLILKDVAYAQERAATRTHERFEAWGIDPARIALRGPSDRGAHMETYRDVDVALDPLSQGGGATTLEALECGVPTVTLRGERLVRRVSASTVTVAGHPEWVAENAAEYVEIAGRVLADRGPQLRDEFLASHICDGAARTRAFEDAVRGLWRQWCQKQGAA
jgi:predicted O-linked N-acetylglucosamine transferase (SPINDLY family)